MASFSMGNFVGSHNGTMVSEEKNVELSKVSMSDKYKIYHLCNEELIKDWEGDIADIFKKYSNLANSMIEASINITNLFEQDIDIFYKDSMKLDILAECNIKGEEKNEL